MKLFNTYSRHVFHRFCATLVLAVGIFCVANVEAAEKNIDFVNDVEPILRKNCYRCHGEVQQKGGLRLSRKKAAFGVADSEEAIIHVGNPGESLLIDRITDADAGDLMPSDSDPLSQKEVQTLSRWIQQGASWPDSVAIAKHWAYQPIKQSKIPNIKQKHWAKNPVDLFVLHKMEQHGLQPSIELEKSRWLRRVSLALIGLPPSIEQVDAFLADHSKNAYEKVVDRLLASKRFGEKWATGWLDLARYADSNGFQADQIRDSWAYRDWVINALNNNMPYDQFVIEQLAGDLLPNATFQQKIATGFHRTVTCNVEAGVHPEENRVNQVFDRVNTTGTVFLGATLECAQCHDHKYDPFNQEDYYRLFAYFNNTPLEVKNTAGVTWDFYGPKVDLPIKPTLQKQRDVLTKQLAVSQIKQSEIQKQSKKMYPQWIAKVAAQKPAQEWKVVDILEFSSSGNEDHKILDDGSILVTGKIPETSIYKIVARSNLNLITAIKIETLTHDKIPGKGPGRGGAKRQNFILSELNAFIVDQGKEQAVIFESVFADYSQNNWEVTKSLDGDRKTGWGIGRQFQKNHWAAFIVKQSLEITKDAHLILKLDQNYGKGLTIGRLKISVFAGDPQMLAIPDEMLSIAKRKKRSKQDGKKLFDYYEKQNPELGKIKQQVKKTESALKKTAPPTSLVMVEMEKPRITNILSRGDYLAPVKKVSNGIPKIFTADKEKFSSNRLGLAKWIVSDSNPLLARVTVNRWWTEIFGRGIVTTPEDFGSQGDLPTHPELLDWLANDLKTNGWLMKRTLKTIVLSGTYRQSSQFTSATKSDPENKWYARGPRFRLGAEIIRDNSLAISGLLSEKMAGPPVMPYQPKGIWRSLGRNQPKWMTAQNEDRFRRGVYIVWKRDAPYPSLVSFDAPDRTACLVNRAKTNTPLQALTLLNDPAYSEMAIGLANRILVQAPKNTDKHRIIYGFRLAVAREPSTQEINILHSLLQKERAEIEKNPEIIKQRTGLNLSGFPQKFQNLKELAAWFAISNVLLNLDETVTQG